MRFLVAVLLALSIMAVAACGGGGGGAGGESAGKAFERQLKFLSDGQAGRAYRELHPAQQAFISQAFYIKCFDEEGSADVRVVKFKESYDEEVTIPGTDIVAMSRAVTAEIEVTVGDQSAKSTDTFHEYLADGRWRFTVADGDAFRDGRCP